jgi:hypothetical protein
MCVCVLACAVLCRSVSDHVYMPAAADAGPAAFMRWLKEYGGGGPPVTKLKDPFVGNAPSGGPHLTTVWHILPLHATLLLSAPLC